MEVEFVITLIQSVQVLMIVRERQLYFKCHTVNLDILAVE